jgi:hypothetical protein
MRILLALPLAGCFLIPRDPPRCASDRTVTLADQDSVARFAGCTRALGVRIETGASIDLAPLAQLEDITGDLAVGPTVGLATVTFDSLRSVGGAVHVSGNGSLRAVFLPVLEHAGRIVVDGNAQLTTVSLPRLSAIAESLVITDNRELALIDASALATVGNELVIAGQPKLALVEARSLKTCGAVRVDADPKLPPALVDKLRATAPP